jgi:hypothetical protein
MWLVAIVGMCLAEPPPSRELRNPLCVHTRMKNPFDPDSVCAEELRDPFRRTRDLRPVPFLPKHRELRIPDELR